MSRRAASNASSSANALSNCPQFTANHRTVFWVDCAMNVMPSISPRYGPAANKDGIAKRVYLGFRAPCYSRWNGEETAKPKRQLSPAAGKQPVTYITSRYLSDIEVENTERGTGRQVVLDVGQGHNLAVT